MGKSGQAYYAHLGTVDRDDVLDGGVPLRLVEAVSAALVERSEGVGEETGDVELACGYG